MITEVVCFVFVFLFSYDMGSSEYDFALLILLFISVTISFSGHTTTLLTNNFIVTHMSKFMYTLYLNHIMIVNLFVYHLDTTIDQNKWMPWYLLVATVFSVLMYGIYLILRKFLPKLKPLLLRLLVKA